MYSYSKSDLWNVIWSFIFAKIKKPWNSVLIQVVFNLLADRFQMRTKLADENICQKNDKTNWKIQWGETKRHRNKNFSSQYKLLKLKLTFWYYLSLFHANTISSHCQSHLSVFNHLMTFLNDFSSGSRQNYKIRPTQFCNSFNTF